jgi:flavin reductase (DIM6/NTAB) family NADH-FMN oxidoreductase RutF
MKVSLGAKTLLYPTPVLIVGTYDEQGKPNMMNAAWGGICCSKPPCVAVSIRKNRHTFGGLVRHQAFTISIPSIIHAKEADYVGIYSGRDEDKFAATGLTATRAESVEAPYVEEFPLVLECKLAHTHDLGVHTQFVGEILDVKADKDVLGAGDTPDIRKIDPFLFSPGDGNYYGIGQLVGKAFSIGRKPEESGGGASS